MTVAFVVWVIALAFVYALAQRQSQSGALTAAVRVSGLRLVTTVARSALTEAAHVIRRAPAGAATLGLIERGASSGLVHDPEATRSHYEQLVKARILTIEPVTFEVVNRPPPEPWLIDFVVRVTYDPGLSGATRFTRQFRQRRAARVIKFPQTMGRKAGQIIKTTFTLLPDPLFEVMEP
jgi:hypothetical protein